jgi:hypothetical protein
MKSKPVERFYAYTLTNSLTKLVFYVGKGQGYRIDEHEREARDGVDNKKCRFIRQIWADGGKVIKTKVQESMAEADAYALEIELIKVYGLANITNFTEGGEGRPQLRTGPMTDYHILLSLDVADRLDEVSQDTGIIAYVEQVLRQHFGLPPLKKKEGTP